MVIFIPVFIAFLLGWLDGSISSLLANLFIIIIGSLFSLRFEKNYRKKAIVFFSIVYTIYAVFSYLVSLSFLNGAEFYASDPTHYLNDYLYNRDYGFDVNRLKLYYLQNDGKDVLYHELLHFISGIGNSLFGGATVYYLTLIQTLFGVLSCLTLLLILHNRCGAQALKFSLFFSIFSIFLLYSSLIVRDIIIAYFFLESIRIVLDEFKLSNLLILVALIILSAGIRLLSGIFLLSALLIYIYVSLQGTKIKNTLMPVFVVLALILVYSFSSTLIFENSITGIEERSINAEERIEENSGLINLFLKLPPGIKQISIALFSQIAPFPSYGTLLRATTFSHYIVGIDVMIFELFWYTVFYTLLISILSKHFLKRLSQKELLLFIMAIIYILALTTHPDIRRMMPVYPIIYILYIKARGFFSKKWRINTNKILYSSYIVLLLAYIIMKGF